MSKKQTTAAEVPQASRKPSAVTFSVELVEGVFEVRATYKDGAVDYHTVSASDSQLELFAALGLKTYLANKVSAKTKTIETAFAATQRTLTSISNGELVIGRPTATKQESPLVRALADVKGVDVAEAKLMLADKSTGFKLSLRREPAIAAALVKYETEREGKPSLLDEL